MSMGALDEKYKLALMAIRSDAVRRRCSFKEAVVRLCSSNGMLNIPLWNEDFDAQLEARADKRKVL